MFKAFVLAIVALLTTVQADPPLPVIPQDYSVQTIYYTLRDLDTTVEKYPSGYASFEKVSRTYNKKW